MQLNFKGIIAEDEDVNKVQYNIDNLVTQLNKTIINGNIVTVNMLAVDTKVQHGLGRPVVGWFVVDKNANVNVWQSTTANEIPNLQIIMQGSTTARVKIYFF